MKKNKSLRNKPQTGVEPRNKNKKNYIGKKSLLRQVEVDKMLFKRTVRIGLITFLLVSSAMFIFIPKPAEAGLVTIVQTSVTANNPEVDVSPGSAGQIKFTGTVQVTNYNTAVPCIVTLMAQSTVGVATIDKPQMVFQGGSQEDTFTVLVQVPIIQTIRQPAQLTISGTWQQGGTSGSVGSSQAAYLVAQFQLMTIYSENPVIETGPGTQAVFGLRIENTGNYRDEFKIDISNREGLEKKGFIIPQLPKTWIELGDPAIFTLPVTLPHEWTIWTDHPETIWIKVISVSSGEAVQEEYPLIIRVRGIYVPGFEPLLVIMSLAFIAVIIKKRHNSIK